MSKRNEKHNRLYVFRYSTLVGILGTLVLIILVKNRLNLDVVESKVTYHGPNPITMSRLTKLTNFVLGKSTQIQIKRTPNPIQTIRPGDFGIAAGGDLTSFSQNELNRYFDNLRSLGTKWVRWDIDWGNIQPNNSNEYQWTATDRVANTAKQYGLISLGIITYTPKWAADSSCKSKFACSPANPLAFAQFAGVASQRYRDTIMYWEIWNEPNIPFFWKPRPDITKYTELLKNSYLEIKKSNPKAIVLSGGLAASGDESDGSVAPLTFIKSLYNFKAGAYFDAIAIHPYSFPFSIIHPSYWDNWQQIANIRQVMIDNRDSNKKIWVTEYGAPTRGPGNKHDLDQPNFTYGSDYVGENTQSQLLIQSTDYYIQNKDWMGPFFWYSMWDKGTNSNTPENFFGLLRHDWTKKPAYDIYKNIIKTNN